MAKFFKKKKFSDEDYQDREYEDEYYEDDEDIDEEDVDDEIDEEEPEEEQEADENAENEEREPEDEQSEDTSDSDEAEDDDSYGEDETEDGDSYDENEADADDSYEEDADVDDSYEEDEEYEEEEYTEEDRRTFRHRRRVRNQIIAYAVVVVFLGAVAAGCVIGGKRLAAKISEKRQEQALAEQATQPQEETPQDVVIETPEPVEEEPTEEDYLGELVEASISEMPLEDKVAGLFVITPEALTGVTTATQAGSGTQDALSEKAIGGLLYSSKNISDKDQITEMLSNTTAMSKYPIFLAVEEEGGENSTVAGSKADVTQTDGETAIGEAGDSTIAHEAGLTIGAYLKEIGFNVDLAPVADVTGESSPLKDRSYGNDAQTVGTMVSNMVEGIEGTGVSSCLKYFPGIGSADEDTENGRVEITKSLDEMKTEEFVPFQAGIDAGADFVMVSNVIASGVDTDGVPSSLSKVVITDVLRNQLGFEGVVITDKLSAPAITQYYTSGEAAVNAITAGADMILQPENYDEAYEAVLAAVQDGTISEERINESLRRIYRIKCAGKLE